MRRLKSQELLPVKPTYLIISYSANALVRSATRAGYSVYSIDCFNDIDTQSLTIQSFQLNLFTSSTLYEDISEIISNIGSNNIDAIVLGSGFEHRFDIVKKLSVSLPVFSNTNQILENAMSARFYFSLLEELDIPFPEICFDMNSTNDDWIVKSLVSAGGYDVKRFTTNEEISDLQYFQKYIEGKLISVNFIANESTNYIFGTNQFWCCDDNNGDFRYSVAVSGYSLSEQLVEQVECIVNKICKAFQLKGLCGLDFIVDNLSQIYLIDINPRPTATFELYDTEIDSLFEAHITALTEQRLLQPQVGNIIKGHQIVYSEKDIQIPNDYVWPEWAICQSAPGTKINKAEPICTVIEESEDSTEVFNLLKKRQQQIIDSLK